MLLEFMQRVYSSVTTSNLSNPHSWAAVIFQGRSVQCTKYLLIILIFCICHGSKYMRCIIHCIWQNLFQILLQTSLSFFTELQTILLGSKFHIWFIHRTDILWIQTTGMSQ